MLLIALSAEYYESIETAPWPVPEEISLQQNREWEIQYYLRNTITGCYLASNELQVNVDTRQLCLVLITANNEICNQFPPGIYLDLMVSNNEDVLIRTKFEDFDYSSTQKLCGMCPYRNYIDENGVSRYGAYCTPFQYVDVAKGYLRSYMHETEVDIGKVSVIHTPYDGCFDDALNKVYVGKTSAYILTYTQHTCDNIRIRCNRPYYKVAFLFYLQDGSTYSKEISQDNETIVYQPLGENILFNMTGDFSELLDKQVDKVRIQFYQECNVTAIFTTYSYVILAKDIKDPFVNPEFRIWPDYVAVRAQPNERAAYYNSLYLEITKCVLWDYKLLDNADNSIIMEFQHKEKKFDFENVARLPIFCNQQKNEQECLKKMQELLGLDSDAVTVQASYYLYSDEGCKDILDFVASYIAKVQDTCWEGNWVEYKKGKLCVQPQINERSNYCTFKEPTPTTFDIQIGSSFHKKITTQYSIKDSEVCYVCSTKSCEQQLQSLWSDGTEIITTIYNNVDGESYSLTVTKVISSDYSNLFSLIQVFGIVLAALIIVVVIYNVLQDKGVSIKLKKHQKVKEVDDMD